MERKEAIEIIKKNWPDSSFTMLREALESLIPELRESDDERIRKEILEYFQQFDNKELRGVDISDWIAWLENTQYAIDHAKREGFQLGYKAGIEKQGEQKPTEEYNITGIKSKHAQGKLGEMIKRKLEMEKQGEQKPEVDQYSLPTSDDSGLPTFNEDVFHPCTENVHEQKPAEGKGMNLDEEEMTPFQKKVFCIIDTTIEEEQGLKQVCDELLRLAHDEIMQNTTWSEEDEARFESCIKVLQTSDGYDTLNAKWLKSLKERYTWKPSEEQIEALKYSTYCPNKQMSKVLFELYQDLKNL